MTLITPLAWLTAPIERLIAILCHTSSRTLTLLAVATGMRRYFWSGFALLTAIDAVAGYYLLSGQSLTVSAWWLELAIAPAAVISIPVVRWCLWRWNAPGAAPMTMGPA
jgi:hypothetical protein